MKLRLITGTRGGLMRRALVFSLLMASATPGAWNDPVAMTLDIATVRNRFSMTSAPGQAQTVATTVWDGVYSAAQAARGKTVYDAQCATCHSLDLRGQGFAPGLVEDVFASRWHDGNLGDLFTIVKVTMPQDNPASLSDEDNAAIVAYLLRANRYPAGEQELRPDPAALKDIVFKRPGSAKQ